MTNAREEMWRKLQERMRAGEVKPPTNQQLREELNALAWRSRPAAPVTCRKCSQHCPPGQAPGAWMIYHDCQQPERYPRPLPLWLDAVFILALYAVFGWLFAHKWF